MEECEEERRKAELRRLYINWRRFLALELTSLTTAVTSVYLARGNPLNEDTCAEIQELASEIRDLTRRVLLHG